MRGSGGSDHVEQGYEDPADYTRPPHSGPSIGKVRPEQERSQPLPRRRKAARLPRPSRSSVAGSGIGSKRRPYAR